MCAKLLSWGRMTGEIIFLVFFTSALKVILFEKASSRERNAVRAYLFRCGIDVLGASGMDIKTEENSICVTYEDS